MTAAEERFSLEQKRLTRANYQNGNQNMSARIISNYGDSGLTEDSHFDILSRFLVCAIESVYRVPTTDRYLSQLCLVKRPESLWITSVGAKSDNPTNQKRKDALENVSIGLAGSFSTNGISSISPSYKMGDIITIKKLPLAAQAKYPTENRDVFDFSSVFSTWDSTTQNYGGWHTEGSSLPYFSNDPGFKATLQKKAIYPTSSNNLYYRGRLAKSQYEAFILNLTLSNTSLNNGLITLFDGSWNQNPSVFSVNGGYIFGNGINEVLFDSIMYEDLNVDGRARVNTNSCIPMVVTTNSSWPTPSQRILGSINYNPSYATIIQK